MVRDGQTAAPLARVQVELLPVQLKTHTGANGRFQFNQLAPGRYSLRAHTVGYRAETVPLELRPDDELELEIFLLPATLAHHEKLDVRTDPFEPVEQESPSELKFEGSEIKNLGSVLADDPLRSLHYAPSVQATDDYNSYFSVRAAAYHRVGIYWDGLLLHAPFHTIVTDEPSGSLAAVQGELAESISLQPGAYPHRYEDRTAAVVDVRSREGSSRSVSAKLNASMSNAGLSLEGPVRGGRPLRCLASFRKSYAQYLIQRTVNDPTLALGFLDTQGQLAWDVPPRHSLRLNWIAGRTDLDRTKAASQLGLNSTMLGAVDLTIVHLRWTSTPNSRSLLQNSLAWMHESHWSRNPERWQLGEGRYREWAYRLNGSWLVGPTQGVEVGWSARRIQDRGWSRRYELPEEGHYVDMDRWTGSAGRYGAYWVHWWAPATGRLRWSTSARWDQHSVNRMNSFVPQTALVVSLTPSMRVRLGWGQYVQFPELRQFYSPAGRATLLPERSIHWIAGLDQMVSARSRLRLDVYQRVDRDLLHRPWLEPRILAGKVFVPPPVAQWTNSVRGYARGFELTYHSRDLNHLAGWISYGFARTQLRDGVTGLRFPSDTDQRHTASLFLNTRLRPTLAWTMRYLYGSGFPIPGFFREEGGRYYLSAQRNQLRLPPYHRLDVRWDKVFVRERWKIALTVEVVNLTHHRNVRWDTIGRYNTRTGAVNLRFNRLFPILPSVGVALEWPAS